MEKKNNILIVLGGGLDKDENLPPHSKLRHDLCYEMHERYDLIICSSKKTYKKYAVNQKKSEAEVGREYLMRLGVPEKKIILEEKSMDTFSNAYYSRKLIEEDKLNPNKIGIITSNFHMPKTRFLFEIVFPKEEFDIEFFSSKDGISEDKKLDFNLKLISEKMLIEFYKEHLSKIYNINNSDMDKIEYFMINVNPALTGKKDKYHRELTEKIEKEIEDFLEKSK